MKSFGFRTGTPDFNPGNGGTMKMVKAFVKRFKKDEDLANHAWVLHVI
ncbi:hypothetical protein AB0L26_19860 [Streptomyces nondiastaticus]